ncbi:MAG: CehA/McbA family metallohydrolase [Dehalococcoidia bacterium]|nr:CehA/McbA family metallohydrolase [Dehalococcoidia bacterium]
MIIDLHAHTLPRSQCSSLWPDDLIDRLKQLGLDGVCLTEHNKVWPKDQIASLVAKHHFLVLGGMEVTTSVGHVLVFGLEDDAYDLWDAKKLRRAVDSAGGVMILAHPLRSYGSHLKDSEYGALFDAIDVLNGTESNLHNESAAALCRRLGLHGVGGSDAHALREVGACATMFEDTITNEGDLIDALKANGYRPHRIR